MDRVKAGEPCQEHSSIQSVEVAFTAEFIQVQPARTKGEGRFIFLFEDCSLCNCQLIASVDMDSVQK